MAGHTIDSLQLEISANARNAEKSLNKLVDSLSRVQRSVSGLSWSNLSGFSNELKKLSDISRGLNAENLTRYAAALNGLNRSVSGLGNLRNIETAANALRQISGLRISGDFSGMASLSQ